MFESMSEESLSQELANLLEVVKRLCQPVDHNKCKIPGPAPDMQIFMGKTLDLYLLMQRNPTVRCNLELQDYLQKSASLLSQRLQGSTFRNYHRLVFFAKLDDTLSDTFYGNEWMNIVCPLRAQLEAFNELYRETTYKEFIDDDFESIDTEIKRVGEIEGGHSLERIPKHVPLSHWWWWYPEEPSRAMPA